MGKDLIIPSNPSVEFRLFGMVEARIDGQSFDLGAEKERCVIAGLLLAKERTISRLDILEWPWDSPPESADGDLDRIMTRLRKRLDAMGIREALVNRDRQCRLIVPPDWVDVHRFRDLVSKARAHDDPHAAELLRTALEVSQGEPLAGLTSVRADTARRGLIEERRAAELDFLRLEIKLSRHRQHIADLTRLFRERPEDVEVTVLAMCALHLAGRRTDALDVYQRHYTELGRIGVDVAPQVRELQTQILRGESLGFDQDFLVKPDSVTGGDVVDDKRPRVTADHPQVVNKVRNVTGENIVFGIQNQAAR